jgi:hypothetical protein
VAEKTKTIQAVIPTTIVAELRARAEVERRSLSAVVRNALEDALRPAPRATDRGER